MVVDDPNMARVKAVQKKYSAQLMSKAHVVGLSIGRMDEHASPAGALALVVLVDQNVPDGLLGPQDRIPRELDGVPVEVREVASLEALTGLGIIVD